MLYLLKLCRYFDERMEALYRQGRLPGAIYSGRGQEGTHVGVAFALEKDDSLFPTHRDLSAQLTKGLDLNRVMAQFWGRIDGYTRGRDGNSHIGDWDGNRTFTVISHLPIAYPVACGAALAYKRKGQRRVAMAICGDGVHVERPVARGPQLVGGASAAGRLGREQQPVRVLHAEPARVPRPDDRRARGRLRHAGRSRGRRQRRRGVRGGARSGRARPGRRRSDADRVRLAPLARTRRPRPGEVHAGRAAAALHGREGPGPQLRGVPALGGRGHEGGHRRGAGARGEGVQRGVRVRAGVTVPRARRRDEGALGRGRVLDERARTRRRDGGADGHDRRSTRAPPDTARNRAGSGATTARRRT